MEEEADPQLRRERTSSIAWLWFVLTLWKYWMNLAESARGKVKVRVSLPQISYRSFTHSASLFPCGNRAMQRAQLSRPGRPRATATDRLSTKAASWECGSTGFQGLMGEGREV